MSLKWIARVEYAEVVLKSLSTGDTRDTEQIRKELLILTTVSDRSSFICLIA
jgi:hypothetical protein